MRPTYDTVARDAQCAGSPSEWPEWKCPDCYENYDELGECECDQPEIIDGDVLRKAAREGA